LSRDRGANEPGKRSIGGATTRVHIKGALTLGGGESESAREKPSGVVKSIHIGLRQQWGEENAKLRIPGKGEE